MDVSVSALGRWLAFVIFFGVAPVIAFAASDNGTLTVGAGGAEPLCDYGFFGSIGSYSPTGLTGGKTVAGLWDWHSGPTCSNPSGHFEASGFSSDPGQSWLTSVTCNGVTKTGAATNHYSYGSGRAEWDWTLNGPFGFSSKIGTQLSCTIVHN
jgi:hypothetical protein